MKAYLNSILFVAKQYLSFDKTEKDLERILSDNKNDQEMKDLAKLELDQLHENKSINEKKLKLFSNEKYDLDT